MGSGKSKQKKKEKETEHHDKPTENLQVSQKK